MAPSHCGQDVVPVAFYDCDHEVQRRLAWERQRCLGHAQGLWEGSSVDGRIPDHNLNSTGGYLDEDLVLRALSETFPGLFDESDPQLLMAFMDVDGDGKLSPAEALHILGAGQQRSRSWAMPDVLKSFWCASSASRALHAVKTMNHAYTRESNGACKMFTLLRLDRVLVSKPRTRGSRAKALSLSFTVGQGDPPSRYELTLTGNAKDDVPQRRWWKTGSLYALTRYHKYQRCTPRGLEAEFCVCT